MTTFDAIRNADTLFVDASIYLNNQQSGIPEFKLLNPESDINLIQLSAKDHPIVIVGNNKEKINQICKKLENAGFTQVFCAGTTEEVWQIKNQ